MALSKNRIKYIRSLELKKNRKAEKVFLAEGPKLVGDLLGHFNCRFLVATAEWISAHRELPIEEVNEVSEEELSRVSFLKTPQQVLGVFEQPDEIFDHIFCSLNTVDVYNPKTIQATMGGIARVKLYYTSLPGLISSLKDTPVYGTFLDGENIYSQPLSAHGLIVMGNEGNGISKEIKRLINRKLYIPNYPSNRETSESLNVAIATAVVCAEFRRQAASL